MALNIFTKLSRRRSGFLGIEKIMLLYWGFTTLLLLLFWSELTAPLPMLVGRVLIVAGLALIVSVYRVYPNRATFLLRNVYQLGLLGFWYGDTYQFNKLFPNLDHLFASFEQTLFGCQPALVFPQTCSGLWWSEAFNLGYWAYYPMIAAVVLATFVKKYHRFEKTAFITLASFFLFYLIYIFLPVTGPQYYFQAIGIDQATAGIFSPVGDYFLHHNILLPKADYGGFFYHLVAQAQASGEFPTAAFPSSHVGVSTIMMILGWKVSARLFWLMLPFYLLLCGATVYIQAHYLIDTIAGFFFGILIYKVSHSLYYTKFFHRKAS